MKLSIITINYNNHDGLRKTIDSVICQTCHDFEWLVIDGGSTDGSRELIESNSNHFAYWVSEKDTGVYNAMNKGIAQARGEWLLFLNSGDCLCAPDTLEKAFAHEWTGDVMYGNAYYVNPDCSYRIKRDPDTVGISFLLNQTFCHQATFIKSSLLKANPYDEQFPIAADWAKWFQLMIEGKRFEHIDEFICNFDTSGIGSTMTDALLQERERVMQKYLPCHVRIDAERIMQMEEKWGFLNKRRSLRNWPKEFYRIALRIDHLLGKIEKSR